MEGKTLNIKIVQLYIPTDPTETGIKTTYAQQYELPQYKNPNQLPEMIKACY